MGLIEISVYLTLITSIVLWAKWSNLDLGLRPPVFKGVWLWIFLFVLWRSLEQVIAASHYEEVDPESYERRTELSIIEYVLKGVIIGPLFEELLFRGALFSGVMRRWGVWMAVTLPSLLWALLHVQYGQGWTSVWIFGLAILLAVIRWKSGSIYLPLSLHAAHNLATVPVNYGYIDYFG